jgi:putative iron-dependent peroxidase
MLRAGPAGEGLMFVSFGCSPYAFEAQMRRRAGHEDRLTDALFRLSAPLSGSHYRCPPVADGRLPI